MLRSGNHHAHAGRISDGGEVCPGECPCGVRPRLEVFKEADSILMVSDYSVKQLQRTAIGSEGGTVGPHATRLSEHRSTRDDGLNL